MYITDKDYFIKSIYVPNVEEHNSEASVELEASIDRYSRQFLKLTLNNVLFSDLDSYITDGVLQLGAPQKWLNLVNGCDYLIGSDTYTWKGLIQTEGLFKESILADYVYLNHYQTEANTMTGQVILEAKNGMHISPTAHLVTIWNEFVDKYQGSTCNQPKQYFHNGILFTDYYGNRASGYVSYLQFLTDNKEDYPDFAAPQLAYKNSFGLL